MRIENERKRERKKKSCRKLNIKKKSQNRLYPEEQYIYLYFKESKVKIVEIL